MQPDALTTPVAESTLERFRDAAAGGQPAPAGVAIAAVSASFAFGLLAKALAVSARREGPAADPAKLEPLMTRLRTESSRLLQLAAEDTAAFEAYLASARLPQASERERTERRNALDAALGKAIDLPFAAAAAAAAGLQWSAEALPLVTLVVLADVGAAVSLLAGALRAFLICAESNVRVLGPRTHAYRERLAQETQRHRGTLQLAEQVLGRVAGSLEAGHPRTEA
jgi:formiminotetrahydrofolate cyclodeaminase